DDVELAVFRITQECLTNIHRHSWSATAGICIQQEGNRLTVQGRDDGEGSPAEKQWDVVESSRGGVGFGGMRERVRQLGGTLKIQSNGTGTAIIAALQIDIGRQGNEQIKELLAP